MIDVERDFPAWDLHEVLNHVNLMTNEKRIILLAPMQGWGLIILRGFGIQAYSGWRPWVRGLASVPDEMKPDPKQERLYSTP